MRVGKNRCAYKGPDEKEMELHDYQSSNDLTVGNFCENNVEITISIIPSWQSMWYINE